MQLSEIRYKDIQRARELVLPTIDAHPRSLIIQGLPGCGVERVFAELDNWLREEWVQVGDRVLVEINLSTFWVKPVLHLVRAIRRDLSRAFNGEESEGTKAEEGDLETALAGLRADVLRYAQGGKKIIVLLDNFDALLKFPDPEQVQNLLNVFQSLGYETRYHTAFIVRCYRDIEDICQAVNYSDFYKIFGTNHHRVSRVSNHVIEKFVCSNSPEHSSQRIESIVNLSAGYLEHAEFLVRCAGSKEEIQEQAIDALALTFEEWVNSLTADEQQVLQLVASGQALGYEHLFAQKKLVRKGILAETKHTTKIASPLFAAYLMARVGKSHGEQVPCIRKASLLSDVHRGLLEQLFQGRHYLQWQLLQDPRLGDATVYLISGEDQRGIDYRPCIVKIHRSDIIDRELTKTEQARDLLGPVVPNVLATASLKGQKAVVFEYATADNRGYNVHQFAEFYRTQPTEQIVTLLRKLFSQVLWPFYQKQSIKPRSANRLYFLPRIDRGEFDKLATIVHRISFYDSGKDMIILPNHPPVINPATFLMPTSEDPTCAYHRLFMEKRNAGLCLVHGDLNPRNFLIDGIGNIHLIDFAAMKEEGGRFLDFARLEAEIKFKLTEEDFKGEQMLSLVAVEELLASLQNDTDLVRVSHLPFKENIAKMVTAVISIRQSARSICQEEMEETDFDIEYKTALLAQTLRIALYEDYLSHLQQELAVVSAALLVAHLWVLVEHTIG